MKPQDLTFVICTESGQLEKMSVLFVMSLRMFGGRFSNCRVVSYQPRKGFDLSRETLNLFESLNVDHSSLELNNEFRDYPLANKPLTCAHAEKTCGTEFLVFADSDQLILGEPNALLLGSDCDVSMRPVDVKNIGATDESDPNFEYWGQLYEMMSVGKRKYVTTTVGQEKILAYWNSGLVVTRCKNSLFSEWENNFRIVMSNKLMPSDGLFFVEQSVLAATICSTDLKLRALPNEYNYPVHMHSGMQSPNKIDRLSELKTIHYHKIFENNPPVHPLVDLLINNAQSKSIARLLRISDVYNPGLLKRIKSALTGKY